MLQDLSTAGPVQSSRQKSAAYGPADCLSLTTADGTISYLVQAMGFLKQVSTGHCV